MNTAQRGRVSQDVLSQLESRIALSQIEAQLEEGLKPIENQDIRNASEGNHGKLVKILEDNFRLYKQLVEQVGLGYSDVLDKAERWFNVVYLSLLLGMREDKLNKCPIGELFKEYGNFVKSLYGSQLGIDPVVIIPTQPQNQS